ncbi:MAG TPA: thioesterase domain-containing protein [Iamia sp.]|nr:thioesterase domain-containing protein [Iamia sp.]
MTALPVRVNENGSQRPVVFFNTWVDAAEGLQRLGAELGPDQPLVGIEHPPMDGPLPRDLADWVRHHRDGLDGLGLGAPYRLAGFSFGGVIALEIARQLRDEGQEVEWLGLIDTLRPIVNPQGIRPYLGYHLRELIDQTDPALRRAHVRRMVVGGGRRRLWRIRHHALRPLRRVGLVPPPPRKILVEAGELRPLRKAVWRGYLTHVPFHYDEPVALFTGDDNRAKADGDPSLRWARYLRGGYEVVPVPGDHLNILDHPHVAVVAAELAASLERARRRGATR